MPRYVVEVSALVDFDEMDPEDLNEEGECAVDGAYEVFAKDSEQALDIFHDKIGIARLDDFMIMVRPATKEDTGDMFMGSFS